MPVPTGLPDAPAGGRGRPPKLVQGTEHLQDPVFVDHVGLKVERDAVPVGRCPVDVWQRLGEHDRVEGAIAPEVGARCQVLPVVLGAGSGHRARRAFSGDQRLLATGEQIDVAVHDEPLVLGAQDAPQASGPA
jgi:hypothetical protein